MVETNTDPIGQHAGPEQQLMMTAMRADLAENSPSNFNRAVEWQQLIETAESHGVLPIVAEYVFENLSDETPDKVLIDLKNRCEIIAQQNLRLLAELTRISALLKDAGVDIISYRGPVLASTEYNSVSRRQFTDIDLFVRHEDIPKVQSILQENGYEPQYECPSTTGLTETQQWAYTRFRRDYPFQNVSSGTVVEIHWRILDLKFPTEVELDDVWDRSKTVEFAGERVRTLSTEDTLFMLCVHGTRHYWERIEWINDVARVINNHDIDWEYTLQKAREHNSVRMFLVGLYLTQRLYATELPPEIEHQFDRDSEIEAICETLMSWLFNTESVSELELQLFQLRMLDRNQDRAKFVLKVLFLPERVEIEAVALPRNLTFLYFIYHLLNLIRNGVFEVVKSINQR